MATGNDLATRKQAVLAAEEARCKALLDNDIETLRDLLSPDLTHTHTNGKTEDYNLYLSLLNGPMKYIGIKRRDLSVRFYGPVAIMEGLADMTGKVGDGDPISLVCRMLQVWVETDGKWRMTAFQGTRIPD